MKMPTRVAAKQIPRGHQTEIATTGPYLPLHRDKKNWGGSMLLTDLGIIGSFSILALASLFAQLPPPPSDAEILRWVGFAALVGPYIYIGVRWLKTQRHELRKMDEVANKASLVARISELESQLLLETQKAEYYRRQSVLARDALILFKREQGSESWPTYLDPPTAPPKPPEGG